MPFAMSATLRNCLADSSGMLDVELLLERKQDLQAVEGIDLQFFKVLSAFTVLALYVES